jgi:hypothetical protein
MLSPEAVAKLSVLQPSARARSSSIVSHPRIEGIGTIRS